MGLINRLTDRFMPPTPQIVRNLAEEMRGQSVGKNWVGEFVSRHEENLKSLYLRCIDNLRVKGEYVPAYQLFYDLVKFYFSRILLESPGSSANEVYTTV